ncbi:MAG: hypothetical protein P3W95_004985 [Tepidimonas taiwanensis]|nr:hypothetical protein [Tepidimonas taiwanensis]
MTLVEETTPGTDTLPVAALRAHLRLGSGFEVAADHAEEAALAGFLRAAIATIEARTGKVLLERVFRLRLSDWRDRLGQPLPLAPVQAVEAVEIEDGLGNSDLVDPALYRLVRCDQRPMLAPAGVILPHVPRLGSVTVRFRAGFGATWDAVPADLAQAVMLLATRYYEDRSFEGSASAMPFGVSALIERWRSVRLMAGRGVAR